ncbi:MAG: helix-turn-helix transcriptional regulator, partial [Solirubrobacterales bacterium]|nr:helix-turn-helix transcriptional regulator [Solirubrobacterales bacterium]
CLERGEYLPRLSTAKALAEVLGVPIQELFPEVGDAAE